MTAIAVIGNCQAGGLALSIEALKSDAEVWHADWGHLKDLDACAAVARRASQADIVFTQHSAWESTGALQTEALRPRVRAMALYPKVHFSGFHPDAIWVAKRFAVSPLGGSFHSRMILSAYLAGIPQSHVADLFNAYFYQRLGYFDEFAKSAAFNIARASALGIDLSGAIARLKPTVFMHAPNHPKISMLRVIAKQALRGAGLDASGDGDARDPLARAPQWPVYPEIAARLGVEGSLDFRRREGAQRTHLSLPQMVKRSYKSYAEADAAKLLRMPAISAVVEVLTREFIPKRARA